MVDVVVNNVMATSTAPDLSTYVFKDKVWDLIRFSYSMMDNSFVQSQYHNYCPVQWGNATSERNCWLGDEQVPLPDVNTEDPGVVATYGDWIENLVKDYNIDGLRIDGMYLRSYLGPRAN